MLLGNERRATAGFTLPEIVVATALVAVFFSSIFEINALCLRYISASKENVGAIEAVHDRLERLRNTNFSTLTSVSSMKVCLPPRPIRRLWPIEQSRPLLSGIIRAASPR